MRKEVGGFNCAEMVDFMSAYALAAAPENGVAAACELLARATQTFSAGPR